MPQRQTPRDGGGTYFKEGALHCRHVLVGKAELDALEAQVTDQAGRLEQAADETERLRRAIHDHRTAGLLADDEHALSVNDNRLWGVLDA